MKLSDLKAHINGLEGDCVDKVVIEYWGEYLKIKSAGINSEGNFEIEVEGSE